FFFNDTPTPEFYTLSLHDALPICLNSLGSIDIFCGTYPSPVRGFSNAGRGSTGSSARMWPGCVGGEKTRVPSRCHGDVRSDAVRSEEHTSELQSRGHLVCRLLLEK